MGLPGAPIPPNFTVEEKLKQYRFYADTAEKVIDRRNSVNRFYITIHTGLLTLITLVAGYGLLPGATTLSNNNTPPTSITAFVSGAQGAIGVFLCLLGAVLSLMWMLNISQYRKLNTAKYDVIIDMEKQLPFQAFAEEWRILMGGARTSGAPVKRFRQVTRVELLLPVVALFVYIIIGVAFGVASGFFLSIASAVTHLF
jgi:ABC-type dipeptide/oligopeptide/nickel transport system permease subunit